MANSKDLLTQILFEAKSYNTYEDIEKLVEDMNDLSMLPIQPLYVSLQASSTDQVALILPKLSKEQRQTFLDLDLWRKDIVDVDSFEYWIEVYSKVQDLELTQEFVSSEDFLLYLKSRVNIYTFDVEDPMYPDHDCYFLTDDNLLLIEYSPDNYNYDKELRYLIRNLYDKHGVENAYTMLFKLVNDSFSEIQEQMYQIKKERLRDYGFVDYYESLERLHTFVSYKQVSNFIIKKKSATPELDVRAHNQSLHSSALVSFNKEMENILAEIQLVKNGSRVRFLHFMFIQLVNSTITVNDALRGGRIELTRIGKVTKQYLELGLQMVRKTRSIPKDESVFDTFDFFDIYRIGKSLVQLKKERVIKTLNKSPFEQDDYEYFLGAVLGDFIRNNDNEIPKYSDFMDTKRTFEITNLEYLEKWKTQANLFVKMIPFINTFFNTFQTLQNEGKLHDTFYYNYTVDNIDFEAITISSFINFAQGNFGESDVNKMGVTISELRNFIKAYFIHKDNEYIIEHSQMMKLKTKANDFISEFGFESIEGFDYYLIAILNEHLGGYDLDSLDDDDFKHIGGPILLNSQN